MGNSVATGHLVQMSGATNQPKGFAENVHIMMYHNKVTPWNPRALLRKRLEPQEKLIKTTPLRFISVEEGLPFFGKEVGRTFDIGSLTREKFVQLGLGLFQQKGLHCSPAEARAFYDIFDSIDMYRNACLSVGELAGLTAFFGGTVAQRMNALFKLLDTGRVGRLSKANLSEYIKPFVWCMVPPEAEVLKPILLAKIVDDIFAEIAWGGQTAILLDDLHRYMRFGYANIERIDHTIGYGNHILNRSAQIIEDAIWSVHEDFRHMQELRDYGEQTWKAQHAGAQQNISDIGLVRYMFNSTQGVGDMRSDRAGEDFVEPVPSHRCNRSSAGSNVPPPPPPAPPAFPEKFPPGSNPISMSVASDARTRAAMSEACSQQMPAQTAPSFKMPRLVC